VKDLKDKFLSAFIESSTIENIDEFDSNLMGNRKAIGNTYNPSRTTKTKEL